MKSKYGIVVVNDCLCRKGESCGRVVEAEGKEIQHCSFQTCKHILKLFVTVVTISDDDWFWSVKNIYRQSTFIQGMLKAHQYYLSRKNKKNQNKHPLGGDFLLYFGLFIRRGSVTPSSFVPLSRSRIMNRSFINWKSFFHEEING